jgi:hypothetical protein
MILASYLYVGMQYRTNTGVSSKLAPVSIVTLRIQVVMTTCSSEAGSSELLWNKLYSPHMSLRSIQGQHYCSVKQVRMGTNYHIRGRIPPIRINWDGQPSGDAGNPENWIVL